MATTSTTDLTTCPICRELFTNPKSLPCLHAFCHECLEGVFRTKSPGDSASCPVCRKQFQIPSDGIHGLQHHFFMQQLLDLNSHPRECSCDKHKDKQLELYCHDCNENMCLTCLLANHKTHNYVEIPEVADNFRLRMNDDKY